MSNFSKAIKDLGWQKIVTWILIVVVFITLIVLCVKVGKMDMVDTVAPSKFKVGGLGSTGLETESNATIVTKKYFTTDNMSITIVDEAVVRYKVFFYTDEQVFISASSSWLDEDFDTDDIPTTAAYFKVVIDPKEDAEVSIFEVARYAKQLTISYSNQ